MKIFSDERLIPLGIISGTASKHSGCARSAQNVNNFFTKFNINPANVLGLKQVHGDAIIQIKDDKDLAAYKAQPMHEADGWLLAKKGLGVMILTADCVPVFIWDDNGQAIGLSHCGWRGVVAKLPVKTGQAVQKQAGKTANLNAFIGPHIGSCCFEVKQDVACQFAPSSVIHRDGKIFIDLTNEIILQLTDIGIKKENIKSTCACTCTCCNRDDFFSFRRDKSRDSLLSFAYMI